jgi:hypothetical protein
MVNNCVACITVTIPDWRGEDPTVYGGPGPDYRGVEGHPVGQSGRSGISFFLVQKLLVHF